MIVLVSTSLWFYYGPSVHQYPITQDQLLTEEIAIRYAERAMQDSGQGSDTSGPVRYGNDTSAYDNEGELLFARNTINPDSGYVMWSNGFSVQIERSQGQIICKVYRNK